MGLVDISYVNGDFFILSAVFILFILSMLSMGVLRLFQLRPRSAAVYFTIGVLAIVAFALVIAYGGISCCTP